MHSYSTVSSRRKSNCCARGLTDRLIHSAHEGALCDPPHHEAGSTHTDTFKIGVCLGACRLAVMGRASAPHASPSEPAPRRYPSQWPSILHTPSRREAWRSSCLHPRATCVDHGAPAGPCVRSARPSAAAALIVIVVCTCACAASRHTAVDACAPSSRRQVERPSRVVTSHRVVIHAPRRPNT